MYHGYLNIDKPSGMTSHDVVAKLRRIAGQRRVGHGGTLDPTATGVLPVALGEATKLVSYLVDGKKRYLSVVRLGIVTSTDDAEGEVLAERAVPSLSSEDIVQALQPFIGMIQQVPPMYSAIQVDGRRMYDLARKGETIELAPRLIEIDRIEVQAWQSPQVTLDITCGKGTYIRALARDLGAALGCGAHLASLRRTQVGSLLVANAVPLTALINGSAQPAAHLLPPEAAIAEWPRIDLDDATAKRIRNGLTIQIESEPRAAEIRAHGPDGALLALLRQQEAGWQPFRVFSWS